MSHDHSLRFEALEARTLLTRAHVALGHPAPAAVAEPLLLDGTLKVDYNSASTSMDLYGTSTKSDPVAGRLGAIGMVHGLWIQSVDAFGNSSGVNTLRLHDNAGSFVITFNTQTLGPAHSAPHGAVFYEHLQRLAAGSGAFAKASENGSIDLITDPTRLNVASIKLTTTQA